jgi:hypothetical protein
MVDLLISQNVGSRSDLSPETSQALRKDLTMTRKRATRTIRRASLIVRRIKAIPCKILTTGELVEHVQRPKRTYLCLDCLFFLFRQLHIVLIQDAAFLSYEHLDLENFRSFPWFIFLLAPEFLNPSHYLSKGEILPLARDICPALSHSLTWWLRENRSCTTRWFSLLTDWRPYGWLCYLCHPVASPIPRPSQEYREPSIYRRR